MDKDVHEVNIKQFTFLEKHPMIPVFTPTIEEFGNGLYKYIENYVETTDAVKVGLCKVIPPPEWSWNQELDSIESETLRSNIQVKPIKQYVAGSRGVYRLDFAEDKKLRLNEFHQKIKVPSWIKNGGHYESLSFYERKFWKALSIGPKPTLYGSDNVGSLFSEELLDGWNFNRLETMMSYGFDYRKTREQLSGKRQICSIHSNDEHTSKKQKLVDESSLSTVTLPGITCPMLYFGAWRTLFGWHSEDLDLYSANYLHFGAPKVWYGVPRTQNQMFESIARSYFSGEFNECSDFLRHKTVLLSPKQLQQGGVHVSRCMQMPGEFMITFPRAYHAGFNCGFNCAEAVNFATAYWLPYGRNATWCKCETFTVKFSVDAFIQNVRTHKPELLCTSPQNGDQILVKWASTRGCHLVRVKKKMKHESMSAQYVVTLLCGPEFLTGIMTNKKLIVDSATDEIFFPTNFNPAWPVTGDIIFIMLEGNEFLVKICHRRIVPTDEITEGTDLTAAITKIFKENNKVNYLEDENITQSHKVVKTEPDVNNNNKVVVGLIKNSRAKDLGIVRYDGIFAVALLPQENFGYVLFDAHKASWRWPDGSEKRYISGISLASEQKDQAPQFPGSINTKSTDSKQHVTLSMTPHTTDGQYPFTLTSDPLWQTVEQHLKPTTQPISGGDIILLRWSNFQGDYLVKVIEQTNGNFSVTSVFDEAKFGIWDFDPIRDEWKRPTLGDLKLLMVYRAKQQMPS